MIIIFKIIFLILFLSQSASGPMDCGIPWDLSCFMVTFVVTSSQLPHFLSRIILFYSSLVLVSAYLAGLRNFRHLIQT